MVDKSSFLFNPLSPNILIQILQTDLHTSPLTISWENLIKDQSIFSMVIILLILITLSLDSVWILLGENCCWSLLALKGSIRKTLPSHHCSFKDFYVLERLDFISTLLFRYFLALWSFWETVDSAIISTMWRHNDVNYVIVKTSYV